MQTPEPLDVLFVSATYPPTRCGVGEYTRRLGMELVREGHRVSILTSPPGHHDHGAEVDGVGKRPAPRRVPSPTFRATTGGIELGLGPDTWDWSALDVVEAVLKSRRPSVVCLQYHGEDYQLHPAVCGIPALAREHGAATVITLHNLQSPKPHPGSDSPLDDMLRESEAWVCTNEIDAETLRARSADKVTVIPSGPCLPGRSSSIPTDTHEEFRLAYFGFLNPQKGLEYLIRAVDELPSNSGIRLTLAAGVHSDAAPRLREYQSRIERQLEQMRHPGRIQRRGYLSNDGVRELLAASDLAVFPFVDGVSGKNSSFWSAMDNSIATLTTRGQGLPDGLTHRQNVLLAEARSANSLREQIEWARENRTRLAAIAASGSSLVHEHFGWPEVGRRTHDVLARCLASFPRAAETG